MSLSVAVVLSVGVAAAQETQEPQAASAEAGEPAVQINPLPFTEQALANGRKHYLRLCQTCHGYDGRALENIDFEATDLTNPEAWRYGTTDGDLFRSTKDGAGQDMPPFGVRLEDRQIWEVVHFLRSLGPEKLRPKLVPNLVEGEAEAEPAAAAEDVAEPPGL
ncbi:MAG TPA: c-type cytochrome [Thermoanaerobaculia bacterium]|nr:c-type cytochrome [Thermoanaerobaculia bacterium]